MTETSNPEIGRQIAAAGIRTNYHDQGSGRPVLMIHGSGPGVTAWANWRLTIPHLAQKHRVVAPDLVGFGYTDAAGGEDYGLELWTRHAIGLLDALGIEQADIIGNSFGGGLALALAVKYPSRVRRMVLMGSVGISFPLTEGLDAVWGYQPSVEAMKHLLSIFAYNQAFATDELAELRYRASVRPGAQEAFSAMFPEPRQNGIEALATPEDKIAALPHPTLVVHGREDKVIPPENAQRLFQLIPNAELHMFGRCGHWTQIEHSERFNLLVDEFLSD